MSQNVNVNLVPGNYPKEFHVSQYDVGRQLVANIVDSTGAYSIPSGATVTLAGTKPSGFGFTLSGSVGSGGVVTFSTTATVTAEYGRIPCEIRITNGSTILGTANCMLIVEESPHPEGTTDGDGEVIVNQITLLLEQITQQADRAVAASEAAQASETAAAASEANAASSESNAAASEATALSAKDDAVAAKTAAQASEQAAAESAAEAEATLGSYAKVGGEYDGMTVGTAKQLLSDSTTTDTEPYIYRQTAGDGDREEVEEVVGGTVAWNQLAKELVESNWILQNPNGMTSPTISDGKLTFGIGTLSNWVGIAQTNTATVGHKYLQSCYITAPKATRFKSTGSATGVSNYSEANKRTLCQTVFTTASPIIYFYIACAEANLEIGDTVVVESPQYFDLTAMFNPTIADAIYAMEQSQAGAGVAWFKALFPKAYYPYNAGELMSVKTSAHVTTGFNQWDEEWEVGGIYPSTGAPYSANNRIRSKNYIKCEPNTTYAAADPTHGDNIQLIYFDENKQFVGASSWMGDSTTATTPSNCHYLKFYTGGAYGGTYNNDICINISDPSKNGTYEPYSAHAYPLSPIDLRGIPKWVDGKLVFDGDVYPPSGEVQRRYGIVDLGTLNWVYDGDEIFRVPDARMKFMGNGICTKYKLVQVSSWSQIGDGEMSVTNSEQSPILRVHDSTAGTDPTAFKTAMSGVYLVYELATPTTETADPYTAIQVCDPNGTEEWTDERTVQVPVGNVTKYHANLKEKLEDLPAIPTAPSANGTYTLKATVSGGAVTYQWVNG